MMQRFKASDGSRKKERQLRGDFAGLFSLQLMLLEHESSSVPVAQTSSRKTNGRLDDGRGFLETALTFHTQVTTTKATTSYMRLTEYGRDYK